MYCLDLLYVTQKRKLLGFRYTFRYSSMVVGYMDFMIKVSSLMTEFVGYLLLFLFILFSIVSLEGSVLG